MRVNTSIMMTEMAKRCMTMKELASSSGINIVTLQRMKSGKTNPQPATIGKLAKALNVNVELLIKSE